MKRLLPAARALSLSLGAGYVLYAFSERMFWSLRRPDDDIFGYVGGWLIYSLFAYLCLAAMRWFGVRGALGVVMGGALFGWLLEGDYAMTLYGDASMPFPLTLSWTGLAWHQTLSFCLGLFGLRICLRSRRFLPSLLLSVAFGMFWGIWASGWNQETPRLSASAASFFVHAALTTGFLAVAQFAIDAAGDRTGQPSLIGLGLVATVAVLFFAGVVTPNIPFAPLILAPLVALTVYGLRRSARLKQSDLAMAWLCAPIRAVNLASLTAIPVVATPVYRFLVDGGWQVPVQVIVAAVSGLAGLAIYLYALVRLTFGREQAVEG